MSSFPECQPCGMCCFACLTATKPPRARKNSLKLVLESCHGVLHSQEETGPHHFPQYTGLCWFFNKIVVCFWVVQQEVAELAAELSLSRICWATTSTLFPSSPAYLCSSSISNRATIRKMIGWRHTARVWTEGGFKRLYVAPRWF